MEPAFPGFRRVIRLHGLDLSYFTGKVEAYLRAKGLPYELVQMDTRSFARLGKITGVRQMPQLELADGTWLTDSTHIIETLERTATGPSLYLKSAALHFVAHVLEDFADEWLWRPAMAYRWTFRADALRAGDALARGMLRDVALPVWARRLMITLRQRHRFVRGDGVNASTRDAVLAVYPQILQRLQTILAQQPYIVGQRPSQADFGFFGSMYRHFGTDPTPLAMMREQAPAVVGWIDRLWSISPDQFANQPEPTALCDAMFPLLQLVCTDYLPYLRANRDALQKHALHVHWELGSIPMCTPVSTYRAQCLQELARRFTSLPAGDAGRVQQWLITSCGHAVDFE
jgi:glutathione S-transferase